MPKVAKDPSLLQDLGVLADLYLTVFSMMGRRVHAPRGLRRHASFPNDDSIEEPAPGSVVEFRRPEPVEARRRE